MSLPEKMVEAAEIALLNTSHFSPAGRARAALLAALSRLIEDGPDAEMLRAARRYVGAPMLEDFAAMLASLRDRVRDQG